MYQIGALIDILNIRMNYDKELQEIKQISYKLEICYCSLKESRDTVILREETTEKSQFFQEGTHYVKGRQSIFSQYSC